VKTRTRERENGSIDDSHVFRPVPVAVSHTFWQHSRLEGPCYDAMPYDAIQYNRINTTPRLCCAVLRCYATCQYILCRATEEGTEGTCTPSQSPTRCPATLEPVGGASRGEARRDLGNAVSRGSSWKARPNPASASPAKPVDLTHKAFPSSSSLHLRLSFIFAQTTITRCHRRCVTASTTARVRGRRSPTPPYSCYPRKYPFPSPLHCAPSFPRDFMMNTILELSYSPMRTSIIIYTENSDTSAQPCLVMLHLHR
jgi:hypothetical protein